MVESRQPEDDTPPDLLLWRKVTGFAPWWAWVASAAIVVGAVSPFWLHTSPAPYHDFHGDVYRGWPLVYGLDQGDVGGDDWGPFVTYLHSGRLALNTLLGLACGVPPAVLVVWGAHRLRRRAGGRGQPLPGPSEVDGNERSSAE